MEYFLTECTVSLQSQLFKALCWSSHSALPHYELGTTENNVFKNPAGNHHCRTSVLALQLARPTLGFPGRKWLTTTRKINFLLHLTDCSNDSVSEIRCTSVSQLKPQFFYLHFVFLGVFINSTLQQPHKNMYYYF